MYQVHNAIIMAAGASSRFAPLSVEYPKALIEVRGEVLIERQIKQLQQAGIQDIYVVVGYMGQCFDYLQEKLGVHIVKNDAYLYRNNNSSIYAVKDIIKNSYICSADNYFTQNPFTDTVEESYYAAVYADGETAEWCMQEDQNGYITDVQVGGRGSWYMLGHVFWSEEFSRKFIDILLAEYDLPESVAAPVKKGDTVGKVTYKCGETVVGTANIVAAEDGAKMGFFKMMGKILRLMLCE
jgi:CTP:phosphocholine cytidylyltransferase-like protein